MHKFTCYFHPKTPSEKYLELCWNTKLWPSQADINKINPRTFPASSIFTLVAQDGKESVCNAGHPGSIPGLGRSPQEGHGDPLQYSCLENSRDRGAWQAIVHGIKRAVHSLATKPPPPPPPPSSIDYFLTIRFLIKFELQIIS